MIDEMQAVGLPEPVFHRNNFMLQTIIRNNEERTLGDQGYNKQSKELPIQEEKLPIELVKQYLIGKDVSSTLFNSVIQ